MNPIVTHNPAVMQEVKPATVTLTLSVKAAQALAAVLAVVRVCDLDDNDLDERLVHKLSYPKRTMKAANTFGPVAIYFVPIQEGERK